MNIIRKGLDKVKEYVFTIDKEFIKKFLETDGLKVLWLFNFEYEYWYDAVAVTNAIVIPINHPLLDLFEKSMLKLGELLKIDKTIILYDVNTTIPFENVKSVTDLKTNSGKYLNKVVKITVNSLAGYISVQETLKQYAGCDVNKVYVPDIGCIPIYLDVRLEGLINWNDLSTPPRREELLITAGISSFHQDKSFTTETGIFELVGKVVSTEEISNSLLDGIAVIICSIKKVGRIDYERIVKQTREEIEKRIGELYWTLLNIYPYQRKPDIPFKVPSKIYKPQSPIHVNSPVDIPEIYIELSFTIVIAVVTPDTPINTSIGNSDISNIYIKVKGRVENIVINFEKLLEKPSNTPDPPGLVYAYYRISTNISKDSIEKATITFSIPKEWLLKQNIEVDNIVLLRYVSDKWERLSTRLISENTTHYIFLAESPGFSYFALSAITEAIEEHVPTTLPIIIVPIAIAVAVVITVLLIIKKRKK